MIKIALATQNKGKVKEITEIFSQYNVEIYVPQGLTDILGPETGSTFNENAEQKALSVARATGDHAIADDSGLEVEALGGRPGVKSARYAGEDATDRDNLEKLLVEMQGVGPEARGARFVCAATLASPERTVKTELGYINGTIAIEPSGNEGFGYDPVFIPDNYSVTMAQISQKEKNKISHRGMAFRKLAASLNSLLNIKI